MILKKLGKTALVGSTMLVLILEASIATAGTIVRVSTTMGDYSIELLDDVTPLTVQNFLNYVSRNDYNGTYLHRVVDDFVVQGGAYRFEPFVGPVALPTDEPVLNEFNVSNTRGTVAMAKVDGFPDSATNQWFVSLVDNSANLDTNNGGFTVFGNVLGEGMAVLDAIDSLPTVTLGSRAPSTPFITPNYSTPSDFVYMNVEVVERFSGAPHVYEVNSGLLIASVNVDDGAMLAGLNFNTFSTEGEVVLQANPESVIPKRDSFDGIATYSSIDGLLRIPSLEVNDGGVITVLNNVVFRFSDPANNLFTLESFSQ